MTTDRTRRVSLSVWLATVLVLLGASASVAATERARRARQSAEPVAIAPMQPESPIGGFRPAPAVRRKVVVVRRSRAS